MSIIFNLIRKSGKSVTRAQRGVSMVEFAIICMLFFATIGFFIELSIAYFDYQLLVNAEATAARRIGVNANGATCDELEQNDLALPKGGAQRARQILENDFGIGSSYFKDVRFCADVIKDTVSTDASVSRCYVRIRAKWPFKCFFCLFYKGGAVLNAEGEAYIEDECFVCPAGAGTGCYAQKVTTGNPSTSGENCTTGSYNPGVPG